MTKINAESLAAAITAAVLAALREIESEVAPTPAPKKAGKANEASARPRVSPPLHRETVLALKAKFRAEHGPRWFEIPAVKAEYNAIRWAKPTAPQDSAPAAKAAEGDLDRLGLRALQALRKEMGLKGRLSESAEAVREQIRGARAAAEPKAKAKAKATGKAKGRAAL